ncbi:hypothetical protein RYX36_009884, partial [Vicia faba]
WSLMNNLQSFKHCIFNRVAVETKQRSETIEDDRIEGSNRMQLKAQYIARIVA